ncbi:hypothetical protein EV356DRAFT_323936 [Viridothelium virens]|uniref:Uncharacterized protein n=1 Tax=Viridothelium virens TaxID=1048519 RepID=A0A6A6GYE9_VIRVR|nr:hypothetical protein EV356DRAFT_323936 [Viridothelium virens]
MSSSPNPDSEESYSPPPVAETSLPLYSANHKTPPEELPSMMMGPPPRPSVNQDDKMVETSASKHVILDPQHKSEPPSSQSGPHGPPSSYAHTKDIVEPPEIKTEHQIFEGPDVDLVAQYEGGDSRIPFEQLHASPPATPEDQTNLEAEPDEPMQYFNWSGLEMRYHDMIKERNQVEHQLLQDFDHLSQFFCQWATAGALRETDRSYKRLKTQATFVNHEERQLEQKRQHYVQVVNAFRSALDLLNGS